MKQLHRTSRLGFNFSYSVPLKRNDASLIVAACDGRAFHRGRAFTILLFRHDKEGRLRDVVPNCWANGSLP